MLLAAAAAVACSGTRPSPSPGGLSELLTALVARGAVVEETVSGDPGCDVAELRDNALRLAISFGGAPERDVYVLEFRNARAFAAAAVPFAECLRARRAGASRAGELRTIEEPPYRVYAVGMETETWARIEAAVRDAAGKDR